MATLSQKPDFRGLNNSGSRQRRLVTVEDVNLALGRLDGHLNRKNDGPPGMITLWRGYLELQALVKGAQLGLEMQKTGNSYV